MKPVLKSLGGKTKLLPDLLALLPKEIEGRFIDPTLGGGALPFHLLDATAHKVRGGFLLSDKNPDLMNVYQSLARSPAGVIRAFQGHAERHASAYFYERRAELQAMPLDAEKAALFLYLGAASFNGLVRYNASGKFNAPFGDRAAVVVNAKALRDLGARLQDCELWCADMVDTVQDAGPRDFLYVDPPYLRSHKRALPEEALGTSAFHSYTPEGFSEADHLRLAYHLMKLDQAGGRFLLCGADNDLYRVVFGRFQIQVVASHRSISARSSGRGTARELFIFNFNRSTGRTQRPCITTQQEA